MCNDAAKLSYGEVDSLSPGRALRLSKKLQLGDRVMVSTDDELFAGTLESLSDTFSSVRVGNDLRLVATAQLSPSTVSSVSTKADVENHKVTLLSRFRAARKKSTAGDKDY